MRTPAGLMERAWFTRTGRLARSFEDYPLLVVQALLLCDDAIRDEIDDIHRKDLAWLAQQEQELGRQVADRGRVAKFNYDLPIETGDSLADQWEQQIARGELPDWMK